MSKRKKSIRGLEIDNGYDGLATTVEKVQGILRKRLCCNRTLQEEVDMYQEQRGQLLELIKRSATVAESNSVLLIGPRGCGKTMLLNGCLDELLKSKEVQNNLLQVHLNGNVQTDDRIALKEITRQLQLENTVGDKVFGSFSETLQFLLASLKSGNQRSKSILFVLDEFDAFAHHKNQTLLYNLFDVAQSAQTPLCVLGLTCRLDVVELLEKRVKSRFSHRQIHLFSDLSFKRYQDIFVSVLNLPDDFSDKKFSKDWQQSIQKLIQEANVLDVLQKQFHITKDIRSLQALLLLPVARLSENHPFLVATDFIDSSKTVGADPKAAMLQGVSILELCLIIAMKHLNEIYDGEPFNFEMVYNEYKKFADRKSSWQMFEKPVILKAFEHLMALEMVRPLDGPGSKTQKEYQLMTFLVDPTQITEALQKFSSCPTEIKQWAASSIVAS